MAQIPAIAKIYLFCTTARQARGAHSLPFNGHPGSNRGPEADHSPHLMSGCKDVRSCASTPPYAFMACTVILTLFMTKLDGRVTWIV